MNQDYVSKTQCRDKLVKMIAGAEADATQQAVDRTTDAATGDKTYSFGGAPDDPLDPNFKSGGNATDGGSKKVDMTQKMATLQEKIRKIKLGIAKEDGTGNELLLMRAEAEADILAINEKQMLPRRRLQPLPKSITSSQLMRLNSSGDRAKSLPKTSC